MIPFKRVLITCLALTSGASAQTWQPLSHSEAETWLYGQLLWYDNGASQFFDTPSGPGAETYTEYAEGRPTQGRYRLIDGEFCSIWPPGQTWDCYNLEINKDGTHIRFIGQVARDTYVASRER